MSTEKAFLNNAEIADRLSALAQLLSIKKENPYKIRAYRRAADTIRGLGESVDQLVRSDGDLTVYAGVGKGISGAIRELVLTGGLESLNKLRSDASPEVLAISAHPRLDPKRVLRIFKKLGISSADELHSALESGEIERVFGVRMAQHVRQGLAETNAILLYRAHDRVAAIQSFLVEKCKALRAEAVGDFRRRVEVIQQLEFVIATPDFAKTAACMESFGGHMPLLDVHDGIATYSLPSGPLLRLRHVPKKNWGLGLVRYTGSEAHVKKLARVAGSLAELEKRKSFPTEESFYRHFDLQFIPPELREGLDEIQQAKRGDLPDLVTREKIRGDLHAHTIASDGVDSLEEMVEAAAKLGYEYVGISDHSPSLTIANGLSPERLKKQLRAIDRLNARLNGSRILKSAEVDILADGSLDYPEELLKELDYTVCSIHSRFGFSKQQQTERILRAMDNPHFTILGHATGRLLLKRPGYELDFKRILRHAQERGCFFELNSSPDRLDVSCNNARLIRQAGIPIAISTDAHSTREFELIECGIEQARRAGLDAASVLNCRPLGELLKLFSR